jgi:hypothetical protein
VLSGRCTSPGNGASIISGNTPPVASSTQFSCVHGLNAAYQAGTFSTHGRVQLQALPANAVGAPIRGRVRALLVPRRHVMRVDACAVESSSEPDVHIESGESCDVEDDALIARCQASGETSTRELRSRGMLTGIVRWLCCVHDRSGSR